MVFGQEEGDAVHDGVAHGDEGGAVGFGGGADEPIGAANGDGDGDGLPAPDAVGEVLDATDADGKDGRATAKREEGDAGLRLLHDSVAAARSFGRDVEGAALFEHLQGVANRAHVALAATDGEGSIVHHDPAQEGVALEVLDFGHHLHVAGEEAPDEGRVEVALVVAGHEEWPLKGDVLAPDDGDANAAQGQGEAEHPVGKVVEAGELVAHGLGFR